jgi:hypothetical protein
LVRLLAEPLCMLLSGKTCRSTYRERPHGLSARGRGELLTELFWGEFIWGEARGVTRISEAVAQGGVPLLAIADNRQRDANPLIYNPDEAQRDGRKTRFASELSDVIDMRAIGEAVSA